MRTTPAGKVRHRLGPDETIPDDEIESIAIDVEVAEPRFRELVERAHRNGLRIVLTRDGEEIAAILPAEHLHRMEEFEDRRDSELADHALEDAEREGTIPWERVKAETEDRPGARGAPRPARARRRCQGRLRPPALGWRAGQIPLRERRSPGNRCAEAEGGAAAQHVRRAGPG
ncbi:MAG: type II toxin-antitoxin system Phd/YefM family antitoxin [Chloroflexi bacterium]|nr:type II toxin-antitoxin system Phd/YefM family antitoxin [Chloroflexota bacterium]